MGCRIHSKTHNDTILGIFTEFYPVANASSFHDNYQDSIRAQIERSLDECVLGNFTECLYEGTMAYGDHSDKRVQPMEVRHCISRIYYE